MVEILFPSAKHENCLRRTVAKKEVNKLLERSSCLFNADSFIANLSARKFGEIRA